MNIIYQMINWTNLNKKILEEKSNQELEKYIEIGSRFIPEESYNNYLIHKKPWNLKANRFSNKSKSLSLNPQKSGYHARAFQPDVCGVGVSFLYFDVAPDNDGSWCWQKIKSESHW